MVEQLTAVQFGDLYGATLVTILTLGMSAILAWYNK